MDLEVVGRHALLFDDDSAAAFVNSDAALVEWNSLSIDRYDVRHLLSGPPPPRNRRRRHASPNPDGSLESELDQERYLDLSSSPIEQDLENEVERDNAGSYHAVAFSYGGSTETSDQKNTDTESGFKPPFSVPEHLLQSLPPSEKVHHIIARTALFVRKHGGQSEIILRVKQGDNPTFGFLMPDHNLHPYFRYLVDHQELLMSGTNGRAMEEENKADSGQMNSAGGALSLLGSVYGTGEDEEGTTENTPGSKTDSEEAGNASDNLTVSHGNEQYNSSLNSTLKDELMSKPSIPLKDEPVSKPSIPSSRERSHVIKRNRSISTAKAETATKVKKEADSVVSVPSTVDKLRSSTSPGLFKVETAILEPPSELKRVVDKIVEFILRNGKEFEGVLVQQDTEHGRFPFLLPSNQYHPYYLKTLQKAQEPRLSGNLGHGLNKKTGSKEPDDLSTISDIPYESDRKEKFKMVIGKSKKDGQDPPSKASQPQAGVSVDAFQAAAILQAATKGIKHPNLGILSKAINVAGQGPSTEGRESLHPSQPQTLNQKQDRNGVPVVSVHAAKTLANSAAAVVASEADSTEASLTREQKLKAERLKRAKMFAALIKSRAAPLKSERSRGLSVDPSESGSDSQFVALAGQERNSSLVPLDVDAHNEIEKPEMKGSVDEHTKRRSKRSYRSRSRREEEEDADKEEEESEESRDHRHSRKRRRSHRSSHHSRDRHKHRKKHSSSKKTESIHHVKDSNSTDDERDHNQDSSGDDHRRSRHRHKYGNSLDDERYSRRRHRHGSSDDEYIHSRNRHKHNQDTSEDEYDYGEEHRRSRHRHKSDSSQDDEGHSKQRHRRDSSDEEYTHSRYRRKHNRSEDDDNEAHSKHRHKHGNEQRHRVKRSQSEREAELEEGEILAKSDQSKVSEGGGDGASREASVDISKSYEEVKLQSQQSGTAQVPNDLRAKVRAMLMATM